MFGLSVLGFLVPTLLQIQEMIQTWIFARSTESLCNPVQYGCLLFAQVVLNTEIYIIHGERERDRKRDRHGNTESLCNPVQYDPLLFEQVVLNTFYSKSKLGSNPR